MPDHTLQYYFFQKENISDFPKESSLRPYLVTIDMKKKLRAEDKLLPKEKWGAVCGLFYLWEHIADIPAKYIGFQLRNASFNLSTEYLEKFLNSDQDVLLPKEHPCFPSFQGSYREIYYSYDFRMLLSILKRDYPEYHEFAQKNILYKKHFIEPVAIMKKEILDAFCKWIFSILHTCDQVLSSKASAFQNLYLEHLASYLFTIYFEYHKEKYSIEYTEDILYLTEKHLSDDVPIPSELTEEYLQELFEKKKFEQLEMHFIGLRKENRFPQYAELIQRYHWERKYYRTTLLDDGRPVSEIQVPQKRNKPTSVKQKRVLIYRWESISHKEAVIAFEKLGFVCDEHGFTRELRDQEERFMEQINLFLDKHDYDLVFSLNYFQQVSEACTIRGIPYISWFYDSPTAVPNLAELDCSTTHVFIFDSNETEKYKVMGSTRVHYMPLAVNVDRYDAITCSKEDHKKYDTDISFVGRLYESPLTDAMAYIPDYFKGYINALMNMQQGYYDYNFFPSILTDTLMKRMDNEGFNRWMNKDLHKTDEVWEEISDATPGPGRMSLLLNRAVTNRERLLLLGMLGKHFRVNLYSSSMSEVLKDVNFCGVVEYYNDSPKVFKCSKLNLNISLHSIINGIPLRCIDVMGCGGALLTSYQKDFEDHFVDQKNILLFHSMEEAFDKAKYYLSHDTEREKLALEGYHTVRKYYNYPEVLKEMMKIADLEYLL